MTTFSDLIKQKQIAKQADVAVEEEINVVEQPKPQNPMMLLKSTLANLNKPTATETPAKVEQVQVIEAKLNPPAQKPQAPARQESSQFKEPTLGDISNYVFKEQPDESTLELTHRFDTMLQELVTATGTDIPKLLAENLNFIKSHPFLAEILKPESIGHLCNAMRKSYGYVVQAKTAKTAKTTKRTKKQDSVMDSLADLNF